MAISRADLLKELLPGLNALFGMEYKSYERKQREAIGGNEYVHAAADGARTAEINGNDVEKNILF
jgi:hypothetical protein